MHYLRAVMSDVCKLTMEKYSTYPYAVEPFSEDFLGNLSWGNLGNLILRSATLHATEHGFGYRQMIEVHHAWVLSRLVIDMEALPRTGEDFAITTWVDRLYRQFTDRHFSITRADGSAYGYASSIWALIDTETRQPADLTQLPDGGFSEALIPDRPSPVSPMGRIRLKSPTLASTHRAAYTDLDINGHVNSIRYLELLLNCFSAAQLKASPVRRIELAYCLEAYEGDLLHIYKDTDTTNPARHLFEIRRDNCAVIVKAAITF